MLSAVDAAMRRRLLAITFVALTLSCLVAPDVRGATATNAYGYLTTFGSPDYGAFGDQYTGVAVGQATGDVFVAEHSNGSLGIYAADASAGGTFLARLDVLGATAPSPIAALNIAVDPLDDSLYVADTIFGNGVARLVSDGAPTPVYTLDPTFAPAVLPSGPSGMAVDPVSHDLLVVDRGAARVHRLSSVDGSTLSTFDGSDSAGGAFQGPGAIAAGPAGVTYVVDDTSSRVERFSATGVAQGALPIAAGSQPGAVAVNPQNGDVVVSVRLRGQTYLQGFDAAGTQQYLSRFPTAAISQDVHGLAWDGGSDRIYVSVGNGSVRAFVPATQPGVDSPVVSNIRRNAVHLAADVAPGGVTTSARFEYCPATAACDNYAVSDPSDASNPWTRAEDQDVSSGPATIQADLPLGSNATWRVRVSADSEQADGVRTESTSATVTFDSPLISPGVETGRAVSVTTTAAELTGTIDTLGSLTTFYFEYGLSTDYGSRVPAGGDGVAGDSRTSRTFSRAIGDLQPGATYHYRLVAQSAGGVSVGDDRTFVTLNSAPAARGYEQVSPMDKKGAAINTVVGLQAAADGSAVSYLLNAAPSDAPSAVLFTRYVSRRADSDWLRWTSADPPLNVSRAIIEVVTHAISPDFTRAFVISNRVLAPGASEGGGNIYVLDLRSGAYTLVGAAAGLSSYLSMVTPQTESMFLASAPDFSWIVFLSPVRLRPDAPATALYRWSRTGGLTLQSLDTGDVQRPSPATEPTTRLVTDDGRIMYYNLAGGGAYRHEMDGTTIPISKSHLAGASNTVENARLDGISRDGRYAFFRSPARLSADAPLSTAGKVYLYRYDARDDALEYAGLPANMDNGRVMAVGDDGRTVYFNSSDGTTAWRDGVLDRFTTSHPDSGPTIGVTSFASPNGRYFGYLADDRSAHFYDAETRSDVCVSCPADGGGGRDGGLPGGIRTVSNRAPQVLTDTGTMFFDTATRLVSADHNGSRDVYSYNGGLLTLISPGDGDFSARFGDATPNGDNVFFTTDQPLVGQDVDQAVDLYDARIGGGFSGQSPSRTITCSRNECAEPATGPVASASATDPPQPIGNARKPAAPARVRLSIADVAVGSRSMRINFRASERGRVRVVGVRVVATVRNVARAGTYSITVPLSRKARAMRSAHRRFKLSVKVTLTGGWGSASAKYSRTLGK